MFIKYQQNTAILEFKKLQPCKTSYLSIKVNNSIIEKALPKR